MVQLTGDRLPPIWAGPQLLTGTDQSWRRPLVRPRSSTSAPERLAGFGIIPQGGATPVPSGPTLSGRLLWGTLLSNNLTWLERTQTDHPRVFKSSVSIESVKCRLGPPPSVAASQFHSPPEHGNRPASPWRSQAAR